MKKVVWKNKSNNQLCVTVPSGSGIKEGDIVTVEKEKIKTIVYSCTTADLFHYGQLQLLEQANKLGDFHICGILTDDAISAYKEKPIATLRERTAIISSLRCVDMVVTQRDIDPTENLKQINNQFKNIIIILVYASNWKKVPGSTYIKKIKGKIVQPPFYERLSSQKIINKIFKIYGKVKK